MSVIFLGAISIALLSVSAAERVMVLTDRMGRKLTLTVTGVQDGVVKGRRENGAAVSIRLDTLCDDDQLELQKLAKGAAAPGTSPKSGTADPVAPAGERPNKRLYPQTVAEMKAAAARIREEVKELKNFTDDERNALGELKIHRMLARVPTDVKIVRRLCDGASRASEACAKLGDLSHEASPEGMKCNLHSGGGSRADTVAGYIEDSGDNNREKRGHRAWCLHPGLRETGWGTDTSDYWHAMWVADAEQGAKPLDAFHAWPAPGFFPVAHMKGNGWTVYPEQPVGDSAEIKVFQLKERMPRPSIAKPPEGAVERKVTFTHVMASGVWRNGAVTFETDAEIKAGMIYWILVKTGSERFSYCVEFVADEV